MSDLPPLPNKPKQLDGVLDLAAADAAEEKRRRAARFAQMIEHILIQPVRRFHRKPPVVISPQVADVFDDSEDGAS